MNKSSKPICHYNDTTTLVYLYIIYEVSRFTSSSENVTKIYLEKTEKWINKGKNKKNEPGSLSHHITTHHPYVHKVSRF